MARLLLSRHHNDSRLRDGIAFLLVLLEVVAYLLAIRDRYIPLNDRPPDFGMSADGDIVKENRVLSQAVTVDHAERANDRAPYGAPASDAPATDVRIDGPDVSPVTPFLGPYARSQVVSAGLEPCIFRPIYFLELNSFSDFSQASARAL